MSTVTRPVMRYPGGKYLLAEKIISIMPSHALYVELFGGAGSVLMRKQRSQGEIYNDLDSKIVDVFRVLRDPERAKELQRLLSLTPFSYDEYLACYEPSDDPVENARRIIYRSYAGIGSDSIHRRNTGFRCLKNYQSSVTAANEWQFYPDCIDGFVKRLQGVLLENRPALRLIETYDRPDTLFYADPPYVLSTRSSHSVRYACEMTDDDHRTLADALHAIRGMAMVSGYRSDLYDELYRDFRRVEFHGKVSTRVLDGQKSRGATECIWLSPNIQTTLF